MRIAVLFDNLGPYHIARLEALGKRCGILAVEQYESSAEYAWDSRATVPFRRVTLSNRDDSKSVQTPRQKYLSIDRVLTKFKPTVIAVPGWAGVQAVAGVIWAKSNNIPVIVMSASQEIDFPRTYFREWIKGRFLSCCAGAIVGGKPHRDYLVKLGMHREFISVGYDVVDNAYFQEGAKVARRNEDVLRKEYGLPERYFFTSVRFIKKKNLLRLIEAFAAFRHEMKNQEPEAQDWDLVLLGDGPLRGELEQLIGLFGLAGCVHLPGFKQYPELPIYYGLADAFILPSTTEQWGLVVNEAMAAGLPVLVSERCGCTTDLIQQGYNGYTFEPGDVGKLSELMVRLAVHHEQRKAMGLASTKLIEFWSPDVFAKNLTALAEAVQSLPVMPVCRFDQFLLRVMLYRQATSDL